MIVIEYNMERDNGEKYLLITFNHHKAEIFRAEIPLSHERCAALRIAKLKEAAIDEFLGTFNEKKYTKKEVLKAYAKVDAYFKDVYKELYPHGGYRNGGRPKGSKTDKTERLNIAVTMEEKRFLIHSLERFRQQKLYCEKFPEEAKKCAPGMLPYVAEGALLSGKLGNSLTLIPERAEEIKNENRRKAKEIVKRKIKENGIDKKAEEGLNYIKEITQEVVEIDGQTYFRAGAVSTKEQSQTGFITPEGGENG